jgi:hypothetical protein
MEVEDFRSLIYVTLQAVVIYFTYSKADSFSVVYSRFNLAYVLIAVTF